MYDLTVALETTNVRIPIAGALWLDADINVPPDAKGVVIFAHGSGSGRHSPRNRYVASELNNARMGTVLVDLLTMLEETLDERSGAYRFDIAMLTERLVQIIDWAPSFEAIEKLPIGLFGASTGAAAALDAAAERPDAVHAVVSRGGRPDLASRLGDVKAPSLLIVGGNDSEVWRLNREAFRLLTGTKELAVIPGATHLFEQPGALEAVASCAGVWFTRYLAAKEELHAHS